MYIKRIRIEGFKSYEKTTTIDNFSPVFNAISGLNGTGKSNILDAICFLLGVTDTKLLRVNNMKEIIHQHGLGMIHEATVSILFDNSDKRQSPRGMEQVSEIIISRKISVEGKHKTLVNGVIWSGPKVKKLFESVHLNVNNPHFIILQGKITQVLNMSSKDIWLMVEDALGAKFFSDFSRKTEGACQKRISNIEEMTSNFSSDMQPLLAEHRRKRQMRKDYFQLLNQSKEMEEKRKKLFFLISLQIERYVNEMMESIVVMIKELKEKYEEERRTIPDGEENEEMKKLEEKLEISTNNFEKVTKELNLLEDNMIPIRHQYESLMEKLEGKRNLLNCHKDEYKELSKKMEKSKEKFENLKLSMDGKRKILSASVITLSELEEGKDVVVSEDNCSRSIQSEIIRQRERIIKLKDDMKWTDEKLNSLFSRRNELNSELEKIGEDGNLQKRISHRNELKREIENFKKDLWKYEDCIEDDLRGGNYWDELRKTKRDLESRIGNFLLKNYQFNFRYRNVHPNDGFDEGLICGFAIKLFKIKDEKFTMALDVSGGHRLLNVVVENDEVASFLLKGNRLPKMTTFLPLNRIKSSFISQNEIDELKRKLKCEGIWRAIDLIQYHPKYQSVMEFVFGRRIICETSDIGMKCFKSGMKNCSFVTLMGDEYNPAGVLTGGMRKKEFSQISLAQQLVGMETEVNRLKKELEENEENKKKLNRKEDERRRLKNELEKKSSQLELIEVQLFVDGEERLKEKLMEVEKEIKDLNKLKENELSSIKLKELEMRLNELISTENHEISFSERKLKLTNTINKIKGEIIDNETELDEFQCEINFLKNHAIHELDEKKRCLLEEIEKKENEKENLKKNFQNQKIKINVVEKKLEEWKEIIRSIQMEIKKLNETMKMVRKEIWMKEEKLMELKKRIDEMKSNEKQLENMDKCLKNIQKKMKEEEEKKLSKMEKKIDYDELIDEDDMEIFPSNNNSISIPNHLESIILNDDILQTKQEFAQTLFESIRTILLIYHHYFDENRLDIIDDDLEEFAHNNSFLLIYRYLDKFNSLHSQYEENVNRLEMLEKNVDVSDEGNGNNEGNMEDITEKIDMVDSDYRRTKLLLNKLNRKKLKEMKDALNTINVHLKPEDENDYKLGVKLVLSLNNHRMESLSELSGGQRSLVALSLILAIQRFTPAPIYILDEIDAALDLSHTANIGQMIRTNFPGAQFIIVSLKEQMFKNAEVCFQTSFRDGHSQVRRVDNRT
ncbi:hypothetical protein SNEBB_007397 [Seison nebaliae]|nr:hypothetical protein SNEBB_007397 [Seison nebaliae]